MSEGFQAVLDVLRIADTPIAAVLLVILLNLWREYRELRHDFTDYLMERAANGDPAAAAVADRIYRRFQKPGD